MQRFRTLSSFVRMLVVLFLAAQFAGVVSSPLASADAFANAIVSHVHHHQHAHYQDHRSDADHQDDQNRDHVDHCCALHAFFAGVLPPVIAVETMDAVGQRLDADVADVVLSVARGRLDRPPKTFAVI